MSHARSESLPGLTANIGGIERRHARCLTSCVSTLTGDTQTYLIIGAAMEVHRILGCGFLEAVYRAALIDELQVRGVPCQSEVRYRILYKDRTLSVRYRADIVCFHSVIVEVKASSGLSRVDEAQAINYMKVSGMRKALLLNFGLRSLQYRRLVLAL